MSVLCDQMLGTLAKWLRIMGVNTLYADRNISDEDLIEIAKNDNRILITRDKELIWNARRNNMEVIFIKSTDLDQQIKTVLKKLDIKKSDFLSRCLICNKKVEKIDKKDVKDLVPKRVSENNDEFWICRNCDKIYWKGSHFKNMIERFKEIDEN